MLEFVLIYFGQPEEEFFEFATVSELSLGCPLLSSVNFTQTVLLTEQWYRPESKMLRLMTSLTCVTPYLSGSVSIYR